MAEDGGANTALATAQPTNEERTQQSDGFTDEELRENIREVLREENGRHWAAVEQLIDTKNNVTAEHLTERIEELMGETRYTKSLMHRILTNSTTEEDAERIKAALDEEQTKERASAAEKKRMAQAEAEAERLRKSQVTPETLERMAFQQSIERVQYMVADRGLNIDPLADLKSDGGILPKDAPRYADGRVNYPAWEREVAKKLDGLVDKKEKEQTPEMPSGRGSSGASSDKALLQKAADPNQSLTKEDYLRIRQLQDKGIYTASQL